MSAPGKISEPVGSQTPDVHEWRRSLRSPSPGGGGGGGQRARNGLSRSRSPSPAMRGRTSLRSRSPSPSRVTIIKHAKGKQHSNDRLLFLVTSRLIHPLDKAHFSFSFLLRSSIEGVAYVTVFIILIPPPLGHPHSVFGSTSAC